MSLIHWWPLNGNTNDYGINSLALINNGATVNSNGKIGKCYYFDGNTSYLQTTIEAGLFDGTGHPFSFAFWMKFTDELVDRKIIFGDYSLANPYFNIEMSYGSASYSGRMRFCWSNGCDYWFTVATGVKDIWQHYAITYDGINKISLYKDGTFIESATATLNAASSGTYYIGRDGRTGSTALKGYLNDFRIYNHALSVKEVKEISKGLVLHYNFEDEYIEPTTNIDPAKSTAPSFSYAATKEKVIFKGKECWHFIIENNGSIWSYSSATGYAENSVLTRSCWLYIPSGQTNRAGWYGLPFAFEGMKSISNRRVYDLNKMDTWQYCYCTGTAQSTSSNYLLYMLADGSATAHRIEFYITDIQLEEKDHATPYVNGTRSTGKVYDNSGYGNNGMVNNSLQVIPGGLSGAHHINLPLASTITYTSEAFNKTELTYSIWFRHHGANGSNATYMFTNGRADYGGLGYGIQIENDSQIVCRYGNSTETVSNCSKDAWHLITVSIKNAVQTIYLDGALVGSFTATVLPSYSDGNGLGLGCFYYNGGSIYHSNCDFADFKIYATALSAEDILAEYNRKAAIDKNGNLFTGEIIETTYNLLTSENLLNGRVKTNATSNVGEIVTRNNYSAYRISPVPYWSGDGATSKNICKGQFGLGQYIFDLWIDVDEVYYDGNHQWVPGGFEVYYTDGSVENVIIDANSTQGHSGYQHLIRKTNANKTISGLGVYYYIGVPVYIRCDSVICKVNSDGKICKNNTIAGGQFVEPAVSDSKCKLTRYGVVSNAIKEL